MILVLEDYKRVSSRALRFEYVDGTQGISRTVPDLNPVIFELNDFSQALYSYFSVFTGMTDLLHGNITMGKANSDYYSVTLESSQALSSTGLFACPEMSPDYWFQNGLIELRNYSLANGVSHSTTFSAMIATTRKSETGCASGRKFIGCFASRSGYSQYSTEVRGVVERKG